MKHVERIALLFTLIVFLLPNVSRAQLQSISRYRVANATAAFGFPVPKGTEVVDNSTGGMYLLRNNASPTASISSLTPGTDYIIVITQTTSGSLVYGLNAEYLDGHTASEFQVAGAATITIKNPGGSVQWTITTGNYNALLIKNASGTAVMYLDQDGNLKVSGDIEAFATIPL